MTGLALTVLSAWAVSAVAAPTTVTPKITGSFKDAPYVATTPDSGTCGNNWAIDLFTRAFIIFPQNSNGTWTVTERFNAGKFFTLGNGETGSGASPGACPSGIDNGHRLREGVSGTFSGSFTITVSSGFVYTPGQGCGSDETNSSAQTDDGCTTKGWIERAFPTVSYGSTATITNFSFTYHALGLTWVNAQAGNSGDIFTS
jgi:hypothetical protein